MIESFGLPTLDRMLNLSSERANAEACEKKLLLLTNGHYETLI